MQLRIARKQAGLTQDELAFRARVHQQTISRIEAGDAPNVSHRIVMRILRGLGVAPCPTCGQRNASQIDEFANEGGSL